VRRIDLLGKPKKVREPLCLCVCVCVCVCVFGGRGFGRYHANPRVSHFVDFAMVFCCDEGGVFGRVRAPCCPGVVSLVCTGTFVPFILILGFWGMLTMMRRIAIDISRTWNGEIGT